MNILIVTSLVSSWPYVPELVAKLYEAGQEPSILDIDTMELRFVTEPSIALVPKFKRRIQLLRGPLKSAYKLVALSRALKNLPGKPWDAINVHYILPAYSLIRKRLRKSGRRLILTYWGSDFLRADWKNLFFQKGLHRVADYITFNNEAVVKSFLQKFPHCEELIRILRFGFGSLDSLDFMIEGGKSEAKLRFGIPDGSVCLAIGYNASRAQNHQTILKAIGELELVDKKRIFLMIPANYPEDPKYIHLLQRLLQKTGCSGVLIDKRLSNYDLCLLRLAADIAVNIQSTDSFSASIQEYAYSGSALILGAWLPYEILENIGVRIYKVLGANDITKAVSEMLNGGLEKWKNGYEARKGIRFLSGWKENISSWINLYSF